MDEVRRLINVITVLEEDLLAQRAADAKRGASVVVFAITGGVAATAIILLFIFALVRREGVRRAQMEENLIGANRRLALSMEGLKRLNDEQKLLSALSEHLQSCRNFAEAKSVITRLMPQLFPHTSGAIGHINASSNLVEMSSHWGDVGIAENVFTPADCWALRRGRQHVVYETAQEIDCPHTTKKPGAVYLCQPMMAQGEALGVLCLQGDNVYFTEHTPVLAQTVAEYISMALANLALQESLRIQSICDPLTGLFNRRYMESSLEREFARARRHGHPLSVLMCDLDHFKRFNDIHGHEAGDILLAEFGKLLKANLRGEDILCRYGGEEFLLILPEADTAGAVRRAEGIRELVRNINLRYRHQPLGPVTISIGVATRPANATEEFELVHAADTALYRAKQAGRDRVELYIDLTEQYTSAS